MSDTPDANTRWRATLDALERIAADPTESPERRRKARNAVRDSTRGSGSAGSLLSQYQAGGHSSHTPNGSLHDLTDATVEGWSGHRG